MKRSCQRNGSISSRASGQVRSRLQTRKQQQQMQSGWGGGSWRWGGGSWRSGSIHIPSADNNIRGNAVTHSVEFNPILIWRQTNLSFQISCQQKARLPTMPCEWVTCRTSAQLWESGLLSAHTHAPGGSGAGGHTCSRVTQRWRWIRGQRSEPCRWRGQRTQGAHPTEFIICCSGKGCVHTHQEL